MVDLGCGTCLERVEVTTVEPVQSSPKAKNENACSLVRSPRQKKENEGER